MAKHTITLDGSHVVTKSPRDKSWTATVACPLDALTGDIVAKLAVHGLQQKIADAAAGATTEDEATAAMQKVIDAILNGEWSSRTAGGGVDEFQRIARLVTRRIVKAKFGAKSPQWAKFTGLEDGEQNEKLDEWFAANETAMRPEVEAEIVARKAEADRKAKAAKAVSFEI